MTDMKEILYKRALILASFFLLIIIAVLSMAISQKNEEISSTYNTLDNLIQREKALEKQNIINTYETAMKTSNLLKDIAISDEAVRAYVNRSYSNWMHELKESILFDTIVVEPAEYLILEGTTGQMGGRVISKNTVFLSK